MRRVSPYGIFVRTKRMEMGYLLVDQADYMGCTPPMLSSVELGRKPVPSGWLSKVVAFFKLDDEGKSELSALIEKSNAVFRKPNKQEGEG